MSLAHGLDADDPVERGLSDVEGTLAIEDDAARIAQLARHRAHQARRGDPEDLTDLESAAHEHAAIGSDRHVGPVVVAGRQSGDATHAAVGSEAEPLSARA